ncbi:hypothetical protein TNCT_452041 [Trichonephila clavata]|uniref:Uncharacterized protein n=1 Tax=Trichonephila clavata TaxID=2740835 RepID=A0A8X6FP55_TRICU|nr:hypothetical protein TNCT_452041 [Trichonephila clavata]
MGQQLLRQLDDDQVFSVNIKKNMIYVSKRRGQKVSAICVAANAIGDDPISIYIVIEVQKIMRLRFVEGIYRTVRCVLQTANNTRKMLEERTFVDCVDKNFAFLKFLPNSVQYRMDRKKRTFRDNTPAGQAVDVPYTEC